MPDFLTGLVGGFQGSREAEYERGYKQDADRRAQEGRVFEYLLQSNDPEMRALALSGLFESAQPGKRKPGLGGYLGELQSGTVYPMIRSRMNEMVPAEQPQPFAAGGAGVGGGPSPPQPGSAAMSANQPVRPGSAPIQTPGTPTPTPAPGPEGAGALGPPAAGGEQAPPTLGGPPPASPLLPGQPVVSRYKRRGTGVPTAEEVAEMQARIPIQTKMILAQQELARAGATPDEIQRALMGMLGAPQNPRQFAAPSFAVEDPTTHQPVPVAFDYTTGKFSFTDGTPVPRGAKFVRMQGGGSGSGGLTSTMRDSPEVRAQYGIENASPTGYWKIKQNPDGSTVVMPSEFIPAPGFAGTTTYSEPDTGVPVRGGIPRAGGPPVPLGVDEPTSVKSQTQTDAESLMTVIDKRVSEGRLGGLPVAAGERDRITRMEAQHMKLPYTSYAEVVRAAKGTPPETQRQRTGGGNLAERIRRRAMNPGAPPPGPAPAPAPTR